jgi:esterase
MKLFYRKFGQGRPLLILHGLFGQSDNWNSLAKQFGEAGFEVYTIDLRNHGLSPHSDVWNYQVMSDDVYELITDLNLKEVALLGHSMGGKVAMLFAIQHPEVLSNLIVVDIAPKYYSPHHQEVLKALNTVDFGIVKTRKETEGVLSRYITDEGTKQFLLKNIFWKENEELAWRFNLKVITAQIENVGEITTSDHTCSVPTLFIRGEKSNYVLDSDINQIQEIFPLLTLKTIAGAGHWVHAEKPSAFFECVIEQIK